MAQPGFKPPPMPIDFVVAGSPAQMMRGFLSARTNFLKTLLTRYKNIALTCSMWTNSTKSLRKSTEHIAHPIGSQHYKACLLSSLIRR